MTRILWRGGGIIHVVAFGAILVSLSPLRAQVSTPPSGSPVDTGYVVYNESPISLPLGIGLRVPVYNRVDGLALPWGPEISLAGDRIHIDPTVTYRSHIGKFDPFLAADLRSLSGIEIEIAGGRGTFTNDGWIRSGLLNSLATIGVGSDARNYFRADRGWAMISKEIAVRMLTLTPGIGARTENDWSTGVPIVHTTAPWSIFGKDASLKMRRPNPSVTRGHVSSALGRLLAAYENAGVKASFYGTVERAFDAPPTPRGIESAGVVVSNASGDFTQLTLDGTAGFPTFRTQRFDFRGHAVLTPGDVAPPQRFAYLGGAGTLATVDLLALGGDRLFYVQGEYSVPIETMQLPIVGNPIVSLRYAAGAAGVGELPDLIQNLGIGVGVRLLKVEYHIDPNFKKTSFTHKNAFTVSLSLEM